MEVSTVTDPLVGGKQPCAQHVKTDIILILLY